MTSLVSEPPYFDDQNSRINFFKIQLLFPQKDNFKTSLTASKKVVKQIKLSVVTFIHEGFSANFSHHNISRINCCKFRFLSTKTTTFKFNYFPPKRVNFKISSLPASKKSCQITYQTQCCHVYPRRFSRQFFAPQYPTNKWI